MVKKQRPSGEIKTIDSISFGFEELRGISYTDAKKDGIFFIKLLQHLQNISKSDWNTAYCTSKHGFGTETISISRLTERAMNKVPAGIDKLVVFRATGDNHAFLGYRDNNTFQVVFIEYKFGDIYKHSK